MTTMSQRVRGPVRPHPAVRGVALPAVAFLLILLVGPADARAQPGTTAPEEWSQVEPINYLPNPYETVRGWGDLPNDRSWGSVSAVHVDVDGRHIWAGDRCGANSCAGSDVDPIVKLNPAGKVVQAFGAGIILWPHGMEVDDEGNVWIADARGASDEEIEEHPDAAELGHAVYKFSPEGELLLTLGTPGEAGDPPTHLTEPADVLVAPNGDIFVSEAHNAQFLDEPGPNAIGRISRYAPDGTYIESWGEWGYEDGQFRGPHALAVDRRGRIFVADRGNRRIQIFEQDGTHLHTWYQFSRISGLYISPDQLLYAIDSESGPNYNPGWRKGVRIGSPRTGQVRYFIPEHMSERASGMGGFGSAGEGVTVDARGNIYAGEVGPVQGLTKYVPRLVP